MPSRHAADSSVTQCATAASAPPLSPTTNDLLASAALSTACPPDELAWRQRQSASLMSTVAAAVAGHTLNLLEHWQACLVLTDRDGVVLASYGHQRLLSSDALLLSPGARWREESLGHNALAETLNAPRANRLARVALEDHEAPLLKGLASASAALLSPACWQSGRGLTPGACEGCLGLICDPYRVRQYSLGMLSVLADDIEQRRLSEHFGADHHLLRLHLNTSQLDSPSAALLAVTPSGVIAAASRRGLQLLASQLTTGPDDNLANGTNIPTRDDVHLLLGQPLDRWQLNWPALTGNHQLTLTDHPQLAGYALRCQQPVPRITPRAPAARATTTSPSLFASGSTTAPLNAHLARLHHGDPGWAQVCTLLQRLVNARLPLLLQGETGVGKEQVVKALHQASNRAHQPLVAINCAALPDELVEAELFGYRRGAFTGADPAGREGRLIEANGGRLFLDEIGDMPLHVQARLLRVLQEREVTPLGGGQARRVDFELVAATHQPLLERVHEGSFRADLYYRLCGATIALPPLRDRQDIEGLSRALLERLCAEQQRQAPSLSPKILRCLGDHDWPGNIRELENCLRLALALCDGDQLDVPHLMLHPMQTLMNINTGISASPAAFSRPRPRALIRYRSWAMSH
ncbi:sigma-54-dependent Fis family transcriptional regulator [Cobetia crustatorum]|uniref:sigma-54-dependent Fis family transcriptional regulator n=1 Tax=Cobetia crustatorum TaxID=553385 RepID=UPI0004BAA94C|nr:sigma 54-interacting transcriptional regulator [Cobetia crustatorum]